MIISLPDTTTRQIAETLLTARENYSLATGRVLTLLVTADARGNIDEILTTLRTATREHPARVLVMILGEENAATSIDAEVLVAADAGASEMVVMHLRGELIAHLDAVITPLLLPDTPIVTWWATTAPPQPSQAQLGTIAQRRITNTWQTSSGDALLRVATGYASGDSDMMWSRITPWRGVVASALDRCLDARVTAVEITGPPTDPSVDIAAGWLAQALDLNVTRIASDHGHADGLPIKRLALSSDAGLIVVEVLDPQTVKVAVPDHPEAFVALAPRTDAECLAEELRHLAPDTTYGRALAGLARVHTIARDSL